MDVFTMVVVIVVVSCGAGVLTKYFESRKNDNSAEASDDMLDEMNQLRQRIEVLEKIVTDESYQLNRELNNLERQA